MGVKFLVSDPVRSLEKATALQQCFISLILCFLLLLVGITRTDVEERKRAVPQRIPFHYARDHRGILAALVTLFFIKRRKT